MASRSCIDLYADVLKYVSRLPTTVHKMPNHLYEHFINAYVFVNEHAGRQKTVKCAQTEWKAARKTSNEAVLDQLVSAIFDSAKEKMKKKPGATTMLSFFKTKPKDSTYQSLWYTSRGTLNEMEMVAVVADCGDVAVIDDVKETIPALTPVLDQTITAPTALMDKSIRKRHISEQQISVVSFFIQALGVGDSLLTDDVTSHGDFMKSLSDVAVAYKDFKGLREQHLSNRIFERKGAKITELLMNVDRRIDELKDGLVCLSMIKVNTGSLKIMLKSCQEKLELMTKTIPLLLKAMHDINIVIPHLQACIRAQKQRNFNKLTKCDEYRLFASNSLGLSWDQAITNILEAMENGYSVFTPLSSQQLQSFVNYKNACTALGSVAMPVKPILEHYELAEDKTESVINQLLQTFPLLCVRQHQKHVLIDFTEMILKPNIMAEILTLELSDTCVTKDECQETVSNPVEGIFMYKKTGPIPMQQKCPELLNVIMEFVKVHGYAAHAQRREGTSTSCGVRLEDIRKHVQQRLPELETISKSKIYNLLKPARQSTREAANHKDCLDIRLGTKNCDVSKENPDAHSHFATVANVRQMCATYPDDCIIFSCDGKAKVHIGGQAVSRYHQIRTFFPTNDMPHYNDHDFPTPGYLIQPDGYLMLSSDSISMSIDKLGREDVATPHDGPMWVFNRCVKNISITIEDHINDQRNILNWNIDKKRPILVNVTDGGPDWTPKSCLNAFYMGRLWRDENLDMLVSVCEPAGLSRFNPIEHKWSACSKWLAGVSLPTTLPGDDQPPENIMEEERLVFNNALDILNGHWDGKKHGGHQVTSVACKHGDMPENYIRYYNDHLDVKRMFDSSLRQIKLDPVLSEKLDEWKFLVHHIDRRIGYVSFKRGSCANLSCMCLLKPVTAVKVCGLSLDESWHIPPITLDSDHPGHFQTFKQLCTTKKYDSPEQHFTASQNGSCLKCRYIFTSSADRTRHTLLVHGGKRENNDNKNNIEKTHQCPVCCNMFPTRYQLQKHQQITQHKLKKGRPSNSKM